MAVGGGGTARSASPSSRCVPPPAQRAACGALGHQKDDDECPKKRAGTNKAAYTMGPVGELAYEVRVKLRDVGATRAIVGTACAKHVAGKRWFEGYRDWTRGKFSYEVVTCSEREPFKFGPGRRLMSICAALLPFQVGKEQLVLRASIIERGVPLLIGKPVLQSLAAHIDFGLGKVVFGVPPGGAAQAA